MAQTTQPAYLSPRPSAHSINSRRNASARKSSLFKPPESPATPMQTPSHRRVTSYTPRYASATATSSGKKRSRPDPSTRADSRRVTMTPQSELGSTWTIPSCESSAVRSDFASPEPFVNTRYHLAGGLDTPGQTREGDGQLESYTQEDLGVRRRWRNAQDDSPRERKPVYPSSANGSSPQLLQQQQQGWGAFVFSVAGKVWSFGSSAFKGFYAGGGQGYSMNTPMHEAHPGSDATMWDSLPDTSSSLRFGRDATPVPGSYPVDDDEIEHEYEHDHRPAKRMHVEGGDSPWVMVQDPTEEDLHRKRTLHKPPPPTRSMANTRRSLIPVTRRTSGAFTSTASPAPQRPASRAHQRSSSDVTPLAKDSPLSPEAHKYLANRKREERQQDASIRRMNEQLKALLKEGRQALGTKVEVLDGDGMALEDEGYFGEAR